MLLDKFSNAVFVILLLISQQAFFFDQNWIIIYFWVHREYVSEFH